MSKFARRDLWPDHWFLSDGENTFGPFSPGEMFEAVYMDELVPDFAGIDPSSIIVSRKGFEKWYAYTDLKNLYEHGYTPSGGVEESLKQELLAELEQIKGLLKDQKNQKNQKNQKVDTEQREQPKSDEFLRHAAENLSENVRENPLKQQREVEVGELFASSPESSQRLSPLPLTSKGTSRVPKSPASFGSITGVDTPITSRELIEKSVRSAASQVADLTEELQDRKIIRDGLLRAAGKFTDTFPDSQQGVELGVEPDADKASVQSPAQNPMKASDDRTSVGTSARAVPAEFVTTTKTNPESKARKKVKNTNEVGNTEGRTSKNDKSGEEKSTEETSHFTPTEQTEKHYYHMILRGRLRLGHFFSPGLQALICLLTFGLSSGFFVNRSGSQVVWHVNNQSKWRPLLVRGMSYIPGVWAISFVLLARDMRKMEMQNHYRETSPALTFLLSLIPPFAVLYLQRKLNRHWHLHVKSYLKKLKKTPKAS